MRFSDIEEILGSAFVDDVEAAITSAATSAHPRAAEALRELLIAMLGAAVITPLEGAEGRLNTSIERLCDVVQESIRISEATGH